jgi:hypothetical protein
MFFFAALQKQMNERREIEKLVFNLQSDSPHPQPFSHREKGARAK